MKQIKNFAAILSIGFILLLTGCDKTKEYDVTVPPPQAHFMNQTYLTYQVLAANTSFQVPIGVTKVADVDRKVTISITSSSAVAGTQYTVTNPVVTIKAGKAIDSLELKGIFSHYQNGEKDTLILAITQPDVAPSDYNDTLRVILRGPCFDGDVTLSTMNGAYAHSNDPDDALYTAQVSNLSTSGTTGTGTISNLWDGMGPVTINFDWTDPTNTIVSIPLQATGINYAAGQPILVRTSPGKINKFSVCNQEINLIVDIIVNNYPTPGSAAYYSQNYRMSIRR